MAVTRTTAASYRFGRFELDVATHRLTRDGRPVYLKPKVFDLLTLLLSRHGELVSKDELMRSLWPRGFVEESNLTQSIYELRRALGSEGKAFVENLPRCGYRFAAEVTTVAAASAGVEAVLAVLPFAPVSGTERDEALELGIAETLITGLSRLRQLMVRPTASVRGFAGAERDSLAAGDRLGADVVLDGSLQRAGERLRVSARLLRVADGGVFWADTFDVRLTDLFHVQDLIAERIVQALALELPAMPAGPLLPRHTENPQIHHLFLRCRYHWHKWTPEHWRRSIECARAALALDPRHAPSWSWMAASWCTLGITGEVPPRQAFRAAGRAVARALELDPELSEAHEVLGAIELFHRWRWPAAERALQRAIALNPGNAGAHDLRALLLVVSGRFDDAIAEARRALEIDPLSLLVNTDVGNVLCFTRRPDEAVAQLRRTLELDPWFAHAHSALGQALLQCGRAAEAVDHFEAAARCSGRDRGISAELAFALAAAGDLAAARRIHGALASRSAEHFVDPWQLALAQLAVGERDQAIDALESAYRQRSRELIYLHVNPMYDACRGDRRFIGLLARIGAPAPG